LQRIAELLALTNTQSNELQRYKKKVRERWSEGCVSESEC